MTNEKEKNYKKMKDYLTQAVKLNPEIVDARIKLGMLLLVSYDIDDAAKKSDNPYFLNTYAWTELNFGNLDESLPLFEKVKEMAPQIPVFRYQLGAG